jgi:hypothetical protein
MHDKIFGDQVSKTKNSTWYYTKMFEFIYFFIYPFGFCQENLNFSPVITALPFMNYF